jgi:hypothetical protein
MTTIHDLEWAGLADRLQQRVGDSLIVRWRKSHDGVTMTVDNDIRYVAATITDYDFIWGEDRVAATLEHLVRRALRELAPRPCRVRVAKLGAPRKRARMNRRAHG